MLGEPEPAPLFASSRSEILSVSALNRGIRDLLEHRYPLLWVAGEISNLSIAKSGHVYFVLKDEQAQVRCVMFRSRGQYLDWTPRDGMKVEVRALVTLYEARGEFQLNVETIRRAGVGALFEAFLKLRDRLEAEGLFDPAAKRPLPFFPRAIGVVTSLQAAALQDVLTTLARRNPSIPVVVYPVPVQGDTAAEKIGAALVAAGRRRDCDVLILCRGGGSMEDLWTFNAETIARAIRACPIPVVTGIGHEIDFTIADFAADHRAPTPTAAAELVSPSRGDLIASIHALRERLSKGVVSIAEEKAQRLDYLARRIIHPGVRLRTQQEVLGHLRVRLQHAGLRSLEERRWRLFQLVRHSRALLPDPGKLGARPQELVLRLRRAAHATLEHAASRCAHVSATLAHLDPMAVLERGYSIVEGGDGVIVRDSATLALGETVAIRFARGRARARIDSKDRS
jgi:exodeoxyribonuclease VII large subunit